MKRLLLLIFTFSFLNCYSQNETIKIGDKFILSTSIWFQINKFFRDKIDILNFKGDLIWTIKDTSTSAYKEALFMSNRNDSFWYFTSKIPDDIFDYKIFKLNEYRALEKKYTRKAMDKLLLSQTWIGMNWEQALIALGHPTEINKTTTSSGTDEQWVYNSYKTKYYYFTNGKLTTIQD